MPLSDMEIKKRKPAAKPYKVFDGGGLYLLVNPNGSKLWRLKYRFHGVEKLPSYGSYPLVPLKDARVWRDEAKRLLLDGIDPGDHARSRNAKARAAAANSFGAIAAEYLTKVEKDRLAERTLRKKRWLLGLVGVDFKRRPIDQIDAADVLAVLKPAQDKENY